MRYLSDEWLAAANTAVKDLTPFGQSLVAGFRIATAGGTESDDRSYSIRLGPDLVAFERGTHQANLIFFTSEEVATEIAQGKRSAQRAFLDSDLHLEGDVSVLLGHASDFAAIDDRLSTLRDQTTFLF